MKDQTPTAETASDEPTPDETAIPELTPAAVKTIIARLGGKLDAVEQKADVPEADKDKIRLLIVPLMADLNNGLLVAGDDPEEIAAWVTDRALRFETLTPLLVAALGLTANDQGSCTYQCGARLCCILTTADGCEGLGQFKPGKQCR